MVKVQINDAEFCIRNKSGLRVRNKLRAKLSLRMSATAEWFLANGLSLNIDKTCGSIFRSDLNCKSVIKKVIIKKLIVANILVLLEYFDIDLTWQCHIKYVFSKLVKFIRMFYRIRPKLPGDVLRMIYFVHIHFCNINHLELIVLICIMLLLTVPYLYPCYINTQFCYFCINMYTIELGYHSTLWSF